MAKAGQQQNLDGEGLAYAGPTRQTELLRAKEISAPELTELYLRRIEGLDGKLNAFRTVLAEVALDEARSAQARLDKRDLAPLLGVPIAVKDNVDVAGELTTNGTGAVTKPAPSDAAVVRQLRAAGAVIIGKTTMPELAIWAQFTESKTWGVTRNPWNPTRSSGGSSGGSAAAVAAGLASAALGSDGGGSIRVPAAMCGLFGLKPQRARISLEPYSEAQFWHGLTHLGPLARTVEDAALFLDVVAEPGAIATASGARSFSEASRTPPTALRIAVSKTPVLKPATLSSEARDAVKRTAELLESLGHHVSNADPPYPRAFPEGLPRVVCGVADDAARLDAPERLERRSRTMARIGRLLHGRPLAWAIGREPAIRQRVNEVFANHDVLLTPVIAQPPPPVERWRGRGALTTFLLGSAPYVTYTAIWNYTGQPAASVPAGFDAEGLPVAVQLVGRPNEDLTLMSLAAQLETHRPWAEHRPPLS
jgi:amidase